MTITETHLAAMVRAIVTAVQPERIILFGSLARGDAEPDSDVDLLVIVTDGFSGSQRWQMMQTIRKAIARIRCSKDILLYSRDEVERWRSSLNHVVATALREGKVIHEGS
ncbi:MAG: nucleotidyltransferase domain-containing protein [Magnetococcales bacterium]|nr:nucleotidyltransferase domain-containing protein [Magnetococcales bacterium]